MGKVHRPLVELQESAGGAAEEGSAHGGRCTEQVDQQPRVAAEVPDQPEVGTRNELLVGGLSLRRRQGGPEGLGQREVVVDAADRLHQATVTVA